jgi:hypothetical protein
MDDSPRLRDDGDETGSRRAFLLGFAGVTGVAVAAGTWRPSPAGAASDGRSYVSGYFALKLDDINCGLIQKFEGGDIEGVVVTEPDPQSGLPKKHISTVKYEDFTVQMGLSPAEPVRKWIESSLQMNFLRKSGELQAADFKRDIRQVREFRDALLTEIGFPALDGAAKDPAYMTLKFAPELTRNKKGSGQVENPVALKKQKQFLPSNFRLTIDGLDKACAKVSKVDALVVKQTFTDTDPDPKSTVTFKEPGKIDFPNLKVTVAEEFARPFFDWHEDFVVNGNNDDKHERRGQLEYLAEDRQTVLLTLTFNNIGIFKGTGEASENNSDKIRRVTFEMYLENVVAKFGG